VQGLVELATCVGLPERASAPLLASAIDFALEGLSAQKKISRSDEWRYTAAEAPTARRQSGPSRRQQADIEDDDVPYPGKKKYYN
jgi:magnesium chelatase subunit I